MNGPLAARARLRSVAQRVVAAAAIALLATAPAMADAGSTDLRDGGTADSAPDPRRSAIALRVGSVAVTVGEIEDRLAEIPSFQRETLGATPEAQVRAYVEQVLARDLVLAEGARQKDVGARLPASAQLARARSNATLRALRRRLPSPAAIPDEDVERFYEENRSRFDSPARVHLWRVLCKTREEAESVLADARREPSTQRWNELAREHSLDKATNLRGGNLGFLAPDGTSNEAGLAVDPALVKAASAVEDGELVPRPVPEGEHFAVVWRRGAVPANRRSLEDAAAQIRTTLFRARTESAERKLIADLREANVRDVDVSLLGTIELGAMDAGLMAPRVVGRPPQASPPGSR